MHFILIRVLAWIPADVQTNSGISDAQAQWFFPLEDQNRQL